MTPCVKLRIELLGAPYPIWREVVVPADLSLDRLHDVIQIAMDWEDRHLHEFRFGKTRYTEAPEHRSEGRDELGVALGSVTGPGKSFLYVYDFGDDWHHQIEVSKARAEEIDSDVPLYCSNGCGCAPPEDVGGVYGLANLLEILGDPKHEERDDYLEWLGGYFDAASFCTAMVNAELAKYLRWCRPRR